MRLFSGAAFFQNCLLGWVAGQRFSIFNLSRPELIYLLHIVKHHLLFLPLSFLFSCGTKRNKFTGLLFSQPPHNLCQFSNCHEAFCGPHTWDSCRKVWKKEKTKPGCVHQHTRVAQRTPWAVSLRTGVTGSRNPKWAGMQMIEQQERDNRHRMTYQCSGLVGWKETPPLMPVTSASRQGMSFSCQLYVKQDFGEAIQYLWRGWTVQE